MQGIQNQLMVTKNKKVIKCGCSGGDFPIDDMTNMGLILADIICQNLHKLLPGHGIEIS